MVGSCPGTAFLTYVEVPSRDPPLDPMAYHIHLLVDPTPQKDFFIHIATISIGLLITIGLQQTVEHWHRLQ
jgi:hypothetical protein